MPKYFQIEVSLEEIEPRIWRRFLLDADASFEDLHDAIQDAFGWTRSHLWEFLRADRRGASIVAPGGDESDMGWTEEEGELPDAAEFGIGSFFTHRGPKKCRYVYDFGDAWGHTVVVRRGVALPEKFRRRLVAGARACPPEDCGGPGAYFACCEFVATGKHPYEDSEDFKGWLGRWKPDAFKLDTVKRKFDRVRR